jgi:hypothetical protein
MYIFVIYETDKKSVSISAFFTAILNILQIFDLVYILALDFEAKR